MHAFRSDLLGYGEDEIPPNMADMDPKMMEMLENFARLSARQQQHILELIRKKRNESGHNGVEGSMDMRYLGYHAMPVASGKVFQPIPPKT